MNLDDKLSTAFARWSQARAELGRLRAQGASTANGGQLAATPEAGALFHSILEQQALCTRLWDELSALAEERAAAGDLQWPGEMQAGASAAADAAEDVGTPNLQAPSSDKDPEAR